MAKQSERGQENIVEQLRELEVPIENLHPDPANARKHNEKNLDAIKASLAAYGQRKPIVVQRQGMIVRAGNGTLQAAKALGWKRIAAVIVDEDNSTAAQFAIADNRTAELAEWDNETLATLLDGWDKETREALAFDEEDIDELMRGLEPNEVVEDEVPEVPVDPITKPGDLWILGEHRVLCGDSTKNEDVERLMEGEKVDLLLTDPPYGIGYGKRGFSGSHGWTDYGVVEWDTQRPAKQTIVDALGRAHRAIIWGGNYFCDYVKPSMGWLVWDKGQRNFSLADCELAWRSEQKAARVLTYARAKALQDGKQHPTQKPVALMAWCLELEAESKSIHDPFLGSGTTLIAAEQLGRKCYGMEISPAYCDVIVKRWETLTGKKAVRKNG